MTILRAIFIACCGLMLQACTPDNITRISTPLGDVIGLEEPGVNIFHGIPFAQAPIGDLRWERARPPQAWGEIKAYRHKNRPGCIQGGSPTAVTKVSQDCLYLDVWAPTSPGPHPVMMWIHGGGMLLGAGNEDQYQGEQLAREHNVVVVSPNYRLSYMGLMSLPESLTLGRESILGNQAYHDQLQALHWIQTQIAAYGGDANNVTVFGESAGAMSACVLLASPLSEGLIDQVILQSGTCNTMTYDSQAGAQQRGVDFINKLGCADAADPYQCALDVPADSINSLIGLEPNEMFTKRRDDWAYSPLPIVGDDLLPVLPSQAFAAGINRDVPVILGTNKDEGSMFVIATDFPEGKDQQAYIDVISQFQPDHASQLADIYLLDQFNTVGDAMSQMVTDLVMACPTLWLAEELTAAGHPVYQYHFVQPFRSLMNFIMALQAGENAPDLGVYHTAEIPFVFDAPSVLGKITTAEQRVVSDLMQSYWASFAGVGDPNGVTTEQWPLFDLQSRAYIEIDSTPSVGYELRKPYCDALQSIGLLSGF